MASSVREALESAYDAAESASEDISESTVPDNETPAAIDATNEANADSGASETEADRAERIRDEKGRFAEGKAIVQGTSSKTGVQNPGKLPTQSIEKASESANTLVERPTRPDSWKKDYWESWEKLDPKVAQYIKQRETEFAHGVSVYKQEWDNAKPLLDAVAPFLPTLKQHNLKADNWITSLGRAHETLALGDAQSKLQMFAKLANDYGVPLQALYDQQAAQQFVQQNIQRQPPKQEVPFDQLFDQKWQEKETNQTVRQFHSEKDAAGNLLRPHFNEVKGDMALLLEAGKADDLQSAYEKALRLNDDLWQSDQDAKQKAKEASRLDAERRAVKAAKGNAVSVRSATPSSTAAIPKNSVRSALEDAYDQHASGRV